MTINKWRPLNSHNLRQVENLFKKIYPNEIYDNLAKIISDYWLKKLNETWLNKSESVKSKDLNYSSMDPLSRIEQKIVLITYADSITNKNEPSINTLNNFLQNHFPAIQGIHILPCCQIVENRFNDGYFSQVSRNKTHEKFGSNEILSNIFSKYFSMADFVLNHIDIQNPIFQKYLNGDNKAGKCFYVFTEDEYQQHLENGDFSNIFRPRPFPLFTIFRRKPVNSLFADMSLSQKIQEMKIRLSCPVDEEILKLLYIFKKIKNDQMLLDNDYKLILEFINYLEIKHYKSSDDIFELSKTQEVLHKPYIFQQKINTVQDLLQELDFNKSDAEIITKEFNQNDEMIFGQYIWALTTFSHVQVDLNTGTFEGLKMLIDDFCWYLSLDLNMLRLDAANFAFKIWHSSCFGLPEVKNLMKILYLSIESVSPRMVANLEVNDKLSNILTQMADKKAPPPMMYDFHLAGILPAVFNLKDSRILERIPGLIKKYNIPANSIRFSLSESHDGKSVRGSMDLLTIKERQTLANIVTGNGGQIKYKSVPVRQCTYSEYNEICSELKLNASQIKQIRDRVFKVQCYGDSDRDIKDNSILYLKQRIQTESEIINIFEIDANNLEKTAILQYFIKKLLFGKEPYELCVTTRDSLKKLHDEKMEIDRYMAFHTLAFALMGKNVKAVYFNDLLGLQNDLKKFKKSGELRDLKRTKSDINSLMEILSNESTFGARVAIQMNNLIALVNSDPALHFRGNEARVLNNPIQNTIAVIYNHYQSYQTFTCINLSENPVILDINLSPYLQNDSDYFDNLNSQDNKIEMNKNGMFCISLKPFARIWLCNHKIDVPAKLLL